MKAVCVWHLCAVKPCVFVYQRVDAWGWVHLLVCTVSESVRGPCELVCVPVGMCNCTDLCGVWACEPICVCVSEDSIWTVPSLPVGRGTTWLSVNHRLTYDLLGSHRHKDTHTHTHKPRYLHIRRYTSTLSRPAVLAETQRQGGERRWEWQSDWVVFSGCESESGIHSDFFKPVCHPAGKPTHSSTASAPISNMSCIRNCISQWRHEGGKKNLLHL